MALQPITDEAATAAGTAVVQLRIQLPLFPPVWLIVIAHPGDAAAVEAERRAPVSRPSRKKECVSCKRSFWTRSLSVRTCGDCRQPYFDVVLLWDFQRSTDGQAAFRRRKCSPYPRARTHHIDQVAKHVVRDGEGRVTVEKTEDGHVLRGRPLPRALPVLREECRNEEALRPCPYVSCRHHQAFEINDETGSIKELFPHLRIYDDPEGPGLDLLEKERGTCALDMADRIDFSEGIGGLLALRLRAASGHPIGQSEGGLALDDAARVLGISPERARQIGGDGLQEIRVALRREDTIKAPRGPGGRR